MPSEQVQWAVLTQQQADVFSIIAQLIPQLQIYESEMLKNLESNLWGGRIRGCMFNDEKQIWVYSTEKGTDLWIRIGDNDPVKRNFEDIILLCRLLLMDH